MNPNRPVLVLQNLTPDGPAYLGTWLKEQGVAYDVFNSEAGEEYPDSIRGYRALALLGGEMSANDDLPSLRRAERLILEAMDADVPVIGHCLGGQLMARALGAKVVTSPSPEIGWQTIDVADSAVAAEWFGRDRQRVVYHWHNESFELPAGAELLAGSAACPHQAFSIGKHLAMQFHVELDEMKLADWSASLDPEFLRLQRVCPTVQSGARMREQAAFALAAQQQFAATLYRRWLGL
jgi:GMP synthase (glutamine-hydrolysing)